MTAELLPYYEQRGLLRRIDGAGGVEEITRRILDVIDKPTDKSSSPRPR